VDPLNVENAANRDRVEPDVVEDFDNLEFDPFGSDYVEVALRRSTLATVAYNPVTSAPKRPNNTGLAKGERTYIAAVDGGSGIGAAPCLATAMRLDDFQGTAPTSETRGSGLRGLAAIDEIALLAAPDEGHRGVDEKVQTALRDAVVLQCEQLADRFGILQLALGVGSGDPANVTPPASTSYAAVYYPWVRVLDPRTAETYLVPPCGHVAATVSRL
jgi:hypothetical protein